VPLVGPLAAQRGHRGLGIEGRRRRPGRHQFTADDARDETEAAAQSGQYPRWRRWVEVVRLPGGPALDTRRHARTRAWTARLSALTHLPPTFGPGMGRPNCICLFASARWDVFSPFFCPRGRVRTRGDRLHRPGGDALMPTTQACAGEEAIRDGGRVGDLWRLSVSRGREGTKTASALG
jgi:hypothetical protein